MGSEIPLKIADAKSLSHPKNAIVTSSPPFNEGNSEATSASLYLAVLVTNVMSPRANYTWLPNAIKLASGSPEI